MTQPVKPILTIQPEDKKAAEALEQLIKTRKEREAAEATAEAERKKKMGGLGDTKPAGDSYTRTPEQELEGMVINAEYDSESIPKIPDLKEGMQVEDENGKIITIVKEGDTLGYKEQVKVGDKEEEKFKALEKEVVYKQYWGKVPEKGDRPTLADNSKNSIYEFARKKKLLPLLHKLLKEKSEGINLLEAKMKEPDFKIDEAFLKAYHLSAKDVEKMHDEKKYKFPWLRTGLAGLFGVPWAINLFKDTTKVEGLGGWFKKLFPAAGKSWGLRIFGRLCLPLGLLSVGASLFKDFKEKRTNDGVTNILMTLGTGVGLALCGTGFGAAAIFGGAMIGNLIYSAVGGKRIRDIFNSIF